jgi:hypothetical protein
MVFGPCGSDASKAVAADRIAFATYPNRFVLASPRGQFDDMNKWVSLLAAIGLVLVLGAVLYQTEDFGDVWASISSLWTGLPSLGEINIPMPKWPFG